MPTTVNRLPQLVVGLLLFGAGIGLVVQGGFGQGPWTVFHQGLSAHTPLSIGGATVVTGIVVLGATLAMRVRIGVGTVLNVVVVGPATDLTIWLVDQPGPTLGRSVLTLAGPFVTALGSALYLGARLGPGPRDGLMTGLHDRGLSIRLARFAIEATAFTIGLALGGEIGWGTVWWLVAIGPAVQWMLPWFDRALVPRKDSSMDPRTVSVSRTIAASPERLWALVADVTRMGEWSPETMSGKWLKGTDEPVVGARFRGENRNGAKTWSTVCEVTECVPGAVFAFDATVGPIRYADWRYDFEAVDGATQVTERTTDRRGWLLTRLGGLVSGVDDRATHNRATMEATLEALDRAATGG